MIKWLQSIFHSLGASGLVANAEAAYGEKQYAEAKQQASEALRIYEGTAPDDDGIVKCLYVLGQALRRTNEEAEAEKVFEKGERIINRTASLERSRTGSTDVANLLTAYGDLKKSQKDMATAEALYRKSLTVLQTMNEGLGPEAVQTLHALGSMCMEKSDYSEASGHLMQALQLLEDFPNHWAFLEQQTLLSNVLSDAAFCQTKLGKNRESAELEARAKEIRDTITQS